MKDFLTCFDLKFRWVNFSILLFFVICLAVLKILGINDIAENTLLENIQLIALAAAFFICLKFKNHKILFNFIAMLIFLMFMRELSYGRCIFCQLPDDPHNFYPWSHYKYGWIAHVIVALYIAVSLIYAVANKVWIDIKSFISVAKIPFWDIASIGIMTIIQVFSESIMHNTCIEETAEFTLYVMIALLVYRLYSKFGKSVSQ